MTDHPEGTITIQCSICLGIIETRPSHETFTSHGFHAECETVCYTDPVTDYQRHMFHLAVRAKLQEVLKTQSIDDPLALRAVAFLRKRIKELL